jgi:hypothetical protein
MQGFSERTIFTQALTMLAKWYYNEEE